MLDPINSLDDPSPSLTENVRALVLDDLLLVIDRNGGTREIVRPDDAAGGICLRIPTIATGDSDGSRPPVPIDRDRAGAGAATPLDHGCDVSLL
jgi:hypothetical protein